MREERGCVSMTRKALGRVNVEYEYTPIRCGEAETHMQIRSLEKKGGKGSIGSHRGKGKNKRCNKGVRGSGD